MNEKINIQELIRILSDKHGIGTQEAETFVREFFLLIESGLERDKYVKVKGLGTFKLIDVDNRESVNVNTGERIEIQGHTKVTFAPENALKEMVNRPFAHFEAVVLNEHVNFDDLQGNGSAAAVEENEVAAAQAEDELETGADEVLQSPLEEVAEKLSEEKVEESLNEKTEETSEEKADDFLNEKAEEPSEEKAVGGVMTASNTKVFYGMLWAVMLVCLSVVAALYWDTFFPQGNLTEETAALLPLEERLERPDTTVAQKAAADTCMQTDDKPVLDSAAVNLPVKPKIATQEKEEMRKSIPQVAKKKAPSQKPFVVDSVSYEIVGTQTTYAMKAGETLTKVALRFYGTKALWPYLVKHNKKVIKNPNNVPYGTVIQIPKLKKKS